MPDELALTAVHGDAAAGVVSADLCVPAGHPALAGHFPGAPVVPGVLLLDAVCGAWQRIDGRRQRLVAIDDVRWYAPLAPAAVASLQATAERQPDGVVLTGEWLAAGVRLGSFRLVLRPC